MEVVKGIGGVVDLAENIKRAFDDPKFFEKDEDGNYWTDSSKLDFPIEKELIISGTGRNNWDAIGYVCRAAKCSIHAGEKDSFGWLSGVIEPLTLPKWTNGNNVCIVYG